MYQILRYAHREEILRLGWRLTIVLVSWWTTGQQLGLQVPEYASTDTNKRNEALARLLHKCTSQVKSPPYLLANFTISLSFEKILKRSAKSIWRISLSFEKISKKRWPQCKTVHKRSTATISGHMFLFPFNNTTPSTI